LVFAVSCEEPLAVGIAALSMTVRKKAEAGRNDSRALFVALLVAAAMNAGPNRAAA
jgi:hypothetical protein